MGEFKAVVDSGERRTFDTGSVRDMSAGKGRFDLMPVYPLMRLAQHYENGATKYDARNWEKGQPLGAYLDSAIRHTLKLLAGWRDEDHAAAAIWNLMSFIQTQRWIEQGKLPKTLDDLSGTLEWQHPVRALDTVAERETQHDNGNGTSEQGASVGQTNAAPYEGYCSTVATPRFDGERTK